MKNKMFLALFLSMILSVSLAAPFTAASLSNDENIISIHGEQNESDVIAKILAKLNAGENIPMYNVQRTISYADTGAKCCEDYTVCDHIGIAPSQSCTNIFGHSWSWGSWGSNGSILHNNRCGERNVTCWAPVIRYASCTRTFCTATDKEESHIAVYCN